MMMLYVVELSPSSSVIAISPEMAAQSLNTSTDGFANNVDARPSSQRADPPAIPRAS